MPNICPLITHTPDNQPLYVTANAAGAGVAPGFLATGAGAISGFKTSNPDSDNVVLMCEDIIGSGRGGVTFTDNSGTLRWASGVESVEAGGNSGSNYALFSYADDGSYLAEPINVNRATSKVTLAGDLVVAGDISGYLPSQTAFDQALIVGPLTAAIPAGESSQDVGGEFTVPKTGLYMIYATAGINVDAVNAAVVGASDSVFADILPVVPGPGGASVNLKPYSMPNTGSSGADYGIGGTAIVLLTAGAMYQAKIFFDNVSGTMAFPGGLSVGINLAALC